MTDADKEKRKKKQKSALEAYIMKVMEQSMKKALDMALDDIFKSFNTK